MVMTREWTTNEVRQAVKLLGEGQSSQRVAEAIDRTPGALQQALSRFGHSWKTLRARGAEHRHRWAVVRYLEIKNAEKVAEEYRGLFGMPAKKRVVLKWVQAAHGGVDLRTHRTKVKPWMAEQIVQRRLKGDLLSDIATWAGVSIGAVRRSLIKHVRVSGTTLADVGLRSDRC